MKHMLTDELQELLQTAFAEAKAGGQAVCLEHLLAALTEAKSLSEIWQQFQVDPQALRSRLLQHVDQTAAPPRQDTEEAHEHDDVPDVQVTFEFQKLIQKAVFRAARNDKNAPVSSQDMLLELCTAQPSYAATALHELGMTLIDVADYIEESALARGRPQPWP